MPSWLTSFMTSLMNKRQTDSRSPPAWQVQDAKARFSEFLAKALSEGPQVVTRRGKEAAVLVSAELWHELEARARPSLKELLLGNQGKTDDLVPPRRRFRPRPPAGLD